MGRWNIDGVWYDANTYAEARTMAQRARPVVNAPVVPSPAVVVTITPVLTPAANFPNRSTVRFGVGEKITLGFVTNPGGRTAASFGGLDWFVKSGPASVVQNPGHLGTGEVTCGTVGGSVVLELRTATAPAAFKATKRFEAIRPNDVLLAPS